MKIRVEYDSCDSGCGDLFFQGPDLNELIPDTIDELMKICERGDEIEANIYDNKTNAYLGTIWTTNSTGEFHPMLIR